MVYQAYRRSIAAFASTEGRFGGPDFSFQRMSWIKPNFLWMMYRSGWATKEGQEAVLAVWLRREAFDTILARAVRSRFVPELYASEAEWQAAVKSSEVRLQWDPDHDPSGGNCERRAIQLGLRGATLQAYATEWIVAIEDVTTLAHEQRGRAAAELFTPREAEYPVASSSVAARLGLERAP